MENILDSEARKMFDRVTDGWGNVPNTPSGVTTKMSPDNKYKLNLRTKATSDVPGYAKDEVVTVDVMKNEVYSNGYIADSKKIGEVKFVTKK